MRASLLAVVGIAACGDNARIDAVEPRTFELGPYDVAPGEEITSDCVQVTLDNDEPIYVSAVELTTGIGFHHSNWFWVPDHVFAGDDGTFRCADRNYNEAIAGVLGGVLFAQSTQAQHEIQAFPAGVVVKIPAHAKIVAGLHLLNATDAPLAPALTLTITPIPENEVTTILAGISFENQSIALPPHERSRFTIECDLTERHQALLGRPPDFRIYYMLPHYHELGAGMTIEAIRDSDGGSDLVFTTDQRIGDALGGPVTPAFAMTGHSRLRFSCTFENPRDEVVRWGVGDQEMCIFLAFSDSPFTWGGGAHAPDDPGPGTVNGDVIDFTHACQLVAADADH